MGRWEGGKVVTYGIDEGAVCVVSFDKGGVCHLRVVHHPPVSLRQLGYTTVTGLDEV